MEFLDLPDAIARNVRRRRRRRARGLHAPHPVRRRSRDHPAGSSRPHPRADDARHGLRPADRRRVRPQADLLVGRQPRCRLAAPLPRRRPERLAGPLEIEEHSHAGMADRWQAGRVRPAVRHAARLRRHQPRRAHRHDRRRSPARSPASSSPRCRRSTPTSASSTLSRPTATATCSSGASPACRRSACSPATRSIVTVEEIVDAVRAPRQRASSCRAG